MKAHISHEPRIPTQPSPAHQHSSILVEGTIDFSNFVSALHSIEGCHRRRTWGKRAWLSQSDLASALGDHLKEGLSNDDTHKVASMSVE
ncbi:hypothetical protein ACE6H2_018342 [Prunus campanulata]